MVKLVDQSEKKSNGEFWREMTMPAIITNFIKCLLRISGKYSNWYFYPARKGSGNIWGNSTIKFGSSNGPKKAKDSSKPGIWTLVLPGGRSNLPTSPKKKSTGEFWREMTMPAIITNLIKCLLRISGM